MTETYPHQFEPWEPYGVFVNEAGMVLGPRGLCELIDNCLELGISIELMRTEALVEYRLSKEGLR